MKKFLIILLFVAIAGVAMAEDTETAVHPQNAVSVNVLGALLGVFEATYERGFGNNIAAKIDVAYSPNVLWITGISTFGVIGEARYYFQSKALEGLYGGIGAGYMTIGGSLKYGTYKAVISGGLPIFPIEFGYKWVFGKGDAGFFIEPFIGYEIAAGTTSITWYDSNNNKIDVPSEYSSISYNASGFLYGVNMGLAF